VNAFWADAGRFRPYMVTMDAFSANSTTRRIALFAVLFSGAMLLSAYAFELIGGLPPCQMCYWQRWAHYCVLGFGVVAYVVPRSWVGPFGVASALGASATVAGFHAGVEYKWWKGPQSCSASPDPSALEKIDGNFFDTLDVPMNIVDCSEAAWSMLGISMAGWNALASLGALAIVIVLAIQAKRA